MTLNHTTHGAVALLELNRPEVRNALSTEALDTLLSTLTELGRDDACRAIVLAGAGPSFCASSRMRRAASSGVRAGVMRALIGNAAIRAATNCGTIAAAVEATASKPTPGTPSGTRSANRGTSSITARRRPLT